MSLPIDGLQLLLVALLALAIGSFLNVLIARLPVMLSQRWQQEAQQTLQLPSSSAPSFNLFTPRSQCPHCQISIAWHDNLPLLGYLKRLGRCASCQKRISLQYPLIEAASVFLTLWIVWHQGLDAQSLVLTGACLMLLTLAVIDLRTFLLPDALTLPLLWVGLLYQLLWQPDRLADAVMGAIAGYMTLWSFYWLFRLITGREGMGRGDFKLLAALGAWCGWQALPLILMLSATTGAFVGIVLQLTVSRLRGAPIPFGPFLGTAGMLILLGGEPVMQGYYTIIGLQTMP